MSDQISIRFTAQHPYFQWLAALVEAGASVRLAPRIAVDLRQVREYDRMAPAVESPPPESFQVEVVQADLPWALTSEYVRPTSALITVWPEDFRGRRVRRPLVIVPTEYDAENFRTAKAARVELAPYCLPRANFAVAPRDDDRTVFYFTGGPSDGQMVLGAFAEAGLPETATLVMALTSSRNLTVPAAVQKRVGVLDYSADNVDKLHRVGTCMVHLALPGWADAMLLDARACGNATISIAAPPGSLPHGVRIARSTGAELTAGLRVAFEQGVVSRSAALVDELRDVHAADVVGPKLRTILESAG